MRLSRVAFNLEKVLLIRVWKLSNPQFPISKLALLLCFRDSWKNASSKYFRAKQSKISCPCDSRDARFELWRFVWFQSKRGFSVESMTHCKFSLNRFWSKFLRWELKLWKETAHAFRPTNENGLWTLKQNGNGAVGWRNWTLNLHKSTQSKSFPPFVVYPRTLFARHFFQQNLMRTLK